jgi:lysophospholipase L1-like esterase
MSRRRRILFRVLAVLLPLLAIEAAARVYWSLFIFNMPEEGQIVQDLMWRQDWQEGKIPYVFPENEGEFLVAKTPTRTNNLGFRGDEWIEVGAGHAGLRVLCVGDSVTFGYTVSGNARAYPAVLERLLRDKDVACQVINGGMPRYRLHHMANLFQQKLPQIRPDVVVVLGGWNDVNDNVLAGPQRRSAAVLAFLKEYLYTVRVASHWRERHLQSVAPGERTPANVNPEGFQKCRESLVRLIGLCRQNGATPVLCTLPSFFARADTEESRQKAGQFTPFGTLQQLAEITCRMNDCIRAVGAAEGVGVCGLEEIDSPSLFSDGIHPNDEGSAAIAARVGRFLLESGLAQERAPKPGEFRGRGMQGTQTLIHQD